MRADFWLYAFSVIFCEFNGYTKGGRAGWNRGSGIAVWIFLSHPLPTSQWGCQKAGTV